MKTKTTKTYNTVKEVRTARTKIAKDLAGKSNQEMIEYFSQKASKSKLTEH